MLNAQKAPLFVPAGKSVGVGEAKRWRAFFFIQEMKSESIR
jgi:hypothetical protein